MSNNTSRQRRELTYRLLAVACLLPPPALVTVKPSSTAVLIFGVVAVSDVLCVVFAVLSLRQQARRRRVEGGQR